MSCGSHGGRRDRFRCEAPVDVSDVSGHALGAEDEVTAERPEEVPDTERAVPALVAPTLSGARAEALARMDAIITSVPARSDDLDGASDTRGAYGFDTLSEAELRQWFADQRTVSGEDAASGFARTLESMATELERVSRERTALAPSFAQEAALLELHETAHGAVEVHWNAVGGTPRRVRGPLFVARDRSAHAVADAFLAERWDLVARLVGADANDSLEPIEIPVYEGRTPRELRPDRGVLDRITYRRVRAARPLPQHFIDVLVTTGRHPYGAGAVLELRFGWDRDVLDYPPGASPISRVQALDAASTALGRDLRPDGVASAHEGVRCLELPAGRRCLPTWQVRWIARGNEVPPGTPDTVYMDSLSGDVLSVVEQTAHYDGEVNITSNIPGDATDQFRDAAYSRLVNYVGGANYLQLTGTGTYSGWVPPTDSVFHQLDTTVGPLLKHHLFGEPECSTQIDTADRLFFAGGIDNLGVPPDGMLANRADHLAWGWYQYLFDVFTFDLFAAGELPTMVRYDAFIGVELGNASVCDGPAGVMRLAFGADDDSVVNTRHFRQLAGHELFHTIQACTELPGAGCEQSAVPNGAPFAEDFFEGTANAFGAWFNQYRSIRPYGGKWTHLRYRGEGAIGDLMLDDDEIDGTVTPPGGCNPPAVYPCAAAEACWDSAHDRARCMIRANPMGMPDNCQALFPGQPLVERQFYGEDATGTAGVPICVHDNYKQFVWEVLGAQLFLTAGYEGIGGWARASRDFSLTRIFTGPAGSDTYHDEMAEYTGDYEVTDAFHTVSTESFPWFDDTTDQRERAELLRIPRAALLTFTNGGPTGTPLQFQSATDVDWFLLPTSQSSTYVVTATTSSTNVDLCVQVYDWLTGAWVANAFGCFDGTSNRNASVTLNTAGVDRFAVRVSHALGLLGAYDLRLQNTTDDFPNDLTSAFASQPLRPGGATNAVAAVLNWGSDADLFRYDRPETGGTGNLQFVVSGAPTPAPTIEIYRTNGTATPSGPPVATGTGSITMVGPTFDHYWVRIVSTGGTGGYNVYVNHTGCSTCNNRGNFGAPRPLPVATGGFVWNRIDASSGSIETPNIADCINGLTCDWYGVQLAANERVTATIFKVHDAACRARNLRGPTLLP